MIRLLLASLFIVGSAFAQIEGADRLNYMLDLDRFHFYTQEWARTMKGRGKVEMAEAVLTWQPTELSALKPDPTKLKDAFNYDALILQYLKKKHPTIKVTAEDVAWGYDFFKRKLNDAYNVKPLKPVNYSTSNLLAFPGAATPYPLKPLDADQVLLNVDIYASDRTTRAVFWEASEAGRRIELHVGTASEFKLEMERRGATVLGEVNPKANNYNPIYLVKNPGESTYHYAITEIAGEDRVRHLAMQSALVRWDAGKGKLAPPPVSVVGSSAAKLLAEEVELTQVLKVLPKADHVVIGQKGAFDRTFGSLGKANAIIDLARNNTKALEATLSADQMKLVTKAMQDIDGLIVNVMKNASAWDKVYDAAKTGPKTAALLPPLNFTAYNLDRASYSVSDYIMKDAAGKEQRWRVFSNSWGDEVVPVAKALKNVGQTNVSYIGTAGALPQSNLKVGDLVIPKQVEDNIGVIRNPIGTIKPEFAKPIQMVTNVSSPYQETNSWLKSKVGLSQAVEVETGYLSSVFTGKNDRLNIMLLVSDVVGSEGETLAEASSSIRRNAQIAAISTIMKEAGVTGVAEVRTTTGLAAMVEELIPTRDPVYKFQVLREAQALSITDDVPGKKRLQALIDATPSFTTSRLQTTLLQSGDRFERLLGTLKDEGLVPRMSLESGFLEGRWGPARPIEVHFQLKTKKAVDEVNQVLALLAKEDKAFVKSFKITVATEAPAKSFVRLTQLPNEANVFMEMYRDSALGFGGLATTETSSGGLKFVRVADPSDGRVLSNLAYFPPDPETKALLQQLKSESGATEVLKTQIQNLTHAVSDKQWEVVLKTVDELPGGALAQIVPEFPNKKNLQITLYMTKKGMSNPAVVLEELIHLQQITGQPMSLGTKTVPKGFVHPYHWAETVNNARAGSLAAAEKLASLELEAAMLSNDSLEQLKANGLFTKVEDEKIFSDYMKAREAQADVAYRDIAKRNKLDIKARELRWSKQKVAFDKLEGQKLKLNDLIAKNDRAGVRKLVDQYLPWDLMEPSEKKMWSEWLEAIEKPNAAKNKLIFRGLDGDLILRTPEGKPFLMSTVLTKNQGSYTRRLRSLATLRDKFGRNMQQEYSQVQYILKGRKDPAALSVMMMNHAVEPKGSPFISASNYTTATGFGDQQMSALRIDERRLMPNALAVNYLGEQERLIPLIVFPDEIVHMEDYTAANAPELYGEERQKAFMEQVEKKIGRKVTPAELSMKESTEQFLESAVNKAETNFLKPGSLPDAKACQIGKGAGPGCDCLFKTLNALLK